MRALAVVLAGSILLGVGMSAAAEVAGPTTVAVYQGSQHLLADGEQVDCPGPVLQTRLTYVAMPGVCDDLGPRRCSGRLVAEIERCAQDNMALGN